VSIFSWSSLIVAAKIMAFSAMIGLSAFGVWNQIRNPQGFSGLVGRGLTLGLFVASVVGYFGFFAHEIYGRIPSTLGGGMPTHVRFVFSDDSMVRKASVLSSAVSIADTTQYELLFSTEKAYVILNPHDSLSSVEIPKDKVAMAFVDSR
jgi:hypothetical protein